jgi:hypothetical protein
MLLKSISMKYWRSEGMNYMLRDQKIKNLMAHPSEEVDAGPIRLWRSMAEQIISVVGQGGFQSLYARSIFLTQRSHPWLVQPAASLPFDLSFATLSTCLAEQPPDQAQAASTLLILTFTDLLASLIGEPLTVRILKTAWGADADDLTDKENENE